MIKNPFILYVKDRIINKKMDLLMACSGERGSGKSWSMMALALNLDPTFNVDRVIFSYNDLIDVAEKRQHPPGSAFIFDEITADAMQARNFMSKKNKNMSALLQTFRSLRYIVILTTPHLQFIDKQARQLLKMVLITTNSGLTKMQAKNYRKVLVYEVQQGVGAQLGYAKTWYKPPVWAIGDVTLEIKDFLIRKPPQDLVDLYEKKKWMFQKKLYRKLRQDHDDGFGKKDNQPLTHTDARAMSNRFGDGIK
jgi:hypothetical protein